MEKSGEVDRRIVYAITISLILLGIIFLVQPIASCSSNITILGSPETPVGVAGYVYQSDGSPIPDGILVVVYNSGNKVYSNTTTEHGVYATGISGRSGDIVYTYVSYNGDYGCNKVRVDTNHVTQWSNITIGEHVCGVEGGFDWSGLLSILASLVMFTMAGVIINKENLLNGGDRNE